MIIFKVTKTADHILFSSITANRLLQHSFKDSSIGIDTTSIEYYATALFHLYNIYIDTNVNTLIGNFIFEGNWYDFTIECESGNITSNSILLQTAIEKVDTLPILLGSHNAPPF